MSKKNFSVEVQEILSKTLEVEADDLGGAIAKAKKMYRNEEIVLDENNHIDTIFAASE